MSETPKQEMARLWGFDKDLAEAGAKLAEAEKRIAELEGRHLAPIVNAPLTAKDMVVAVALKVASAPTPADKTALDKVMILLDEMVVAVAERDAQWQAKLDDQIRENSLMVTEDLVKERGAQEILYDRLAHAVELMRKEIRSTLCIMVDPKVVGRKGGITNPDDVPDCGCWWCEVRAYIRQYDQWANPAPDSDALADIIEHEPIHRWFELSYAQYLTIPRTALQSMPLGWQQRFVRCLEELDRRIDWRPEDGRYWVKLKDHAGRYLYDPLADYERGRRRLRVKP